MVKPPAARDKLLSAAHALIREKGFNAMSVDELCARAGVTKGAFFHYFRSKDELGVAAAIHWSVVTGALFAQAEYHSRASALERVLAYIDLRRSLVRGEIAEFSCVAGTMVQETYREHPAIREACGACIVDHAQTLVADIQAAIEERGIVAEWTAESLATHTQAVIQGAFVLAKATGDAAVALESVDHLRRYVTLLFATASQREPSSATAPRSAARRRTRT